MANLNAPFGLKPIRRLGGGSITLTAYTIASGYNANIGIGSPVIMTGTGRNIALCAGAGTAIPVGIFNGCKYVDSTGELRFSKSWPAGTVATQIEAYVYDQPDLVCIAQIATAAADDQGSNCDLSTNNTSTFTAATGVSATELQGSFDVSGKTFHLLGLADLPNNAWGAYAKVEVAFVEHFFATDTGV